MPRPRRTAAGSLPPLLVRLIHALEERDDSTAAGALRAFGELALVAIPARGVFEPREHDVFLNVGRIADRHWRLTRRRRAFERTLKALGSVERWSSIEAAQGDLESASDTTFYYLGLAFGVTLAELAGHR